MKDDDMISQELAARLADLDPIDMTMDPALETAIAEIRRALDGLTGEARRKRASGLRFRGAGHPIGAVPDLPPDES